MYKLLKERFPMKYIIISTALILKPPLFMCKAKVNGHVFVCEGLLFCLLLVIVRTVTQCICLFFILLTQLTFSNVHL